jgi:hypothetical protein
MGTVALYTFVAGTVPTASQWNQNPVAIAAVINGEIDEANIQTSDANGVVGMSVSQTSAGSNPITGAKDFTGAIGIAGATTLSNTLTVGENGTGHDVKFFGDTAGAHMLWDEGTDDLVLAGAAQLYLYDAGGGEHLSSNGTDLTINSGRNINLTCASGDVVIPANIGLTFGDAAEKIEGDGTDLTISGNNIKLTATADVVVPANVGITFGSGEKIEGDDTDLTVTSGGDINLSTGTGALSITAGDVTFYDDNNNADVTMKMGTGSAEALEIAVLNGGSNKTAEEVRFTSKTASATGDHGKIAFYVDDAEIGTFDDGGLDLASGKSFTVAGSALSSGAALTGSTDNTITTVTGADAIQGEANLTWNGNWMGMHETANVNLTKGLTINQEAADDHIISLKSSDIGHVMTDKAEADTYGLFMKSHTTGGGLEISGLADTHAGGNQALELSGYLGEAAETIDTTSSRGVVWITANVTDGTTSWQGPASSGCAVVLASGTTARVVMKGDGTIHASDTSWADSLDDLPDAISGRSLTTQRAVESGGVLAGYQIHAPELVDALEARGIVTAAEKPGEGEIPGHRFLNLQKGVKFSWDMAFQNFCWLAHLIERHVPADEIKNFPMASELQSGLRYLEKGRNNGSHL